VILSNKLSIRLLPQAEWYSIGKSDAVGGVLRFGGTGGLGWKF